MPSPPCLDRTSALPPVASGMWQSGGKAFSSSRSPNFSQECLNGSSEQVCGLSKPSKNAIKAFHFTGSKQSPYRAKWLIFDAQVETFQLANLSRGPQKSCMCIGTFSGHHVKSVRTEQASRGLHLSVQRSKEFQCRTSRSRPPHVAPTHSGRVHVEHNMNDVFSGNASVGKEPLFQGSYAITKKPFIHSSDTIKHAMAVNRNTGGIESPYLKDVEASPRDVLYAAYRNAHTADDSESITHTCNGIQPVNVDDHHRSFSHGADGGDGSTPHEQGVMAASFSTNGGSMEAALSRDDNQDVPSEHGNGGEEALSPSMIGIDTNDSANSPCKVAAVRMPTYRASASQDSVNDITHYMESLGVDCVRLFHNEPALKSCTLNQIKGLVSALEGYGFQLKDAGRVFVLCPNLLRLDPKDLEVVTGFLFKEVGLSPKDFGRLIERCPRVLIADLNTHLRPTLSFLRTLGFARIGQAITSNPAILSYNVERRILPRLRFLESWGFTYREAASMVVRFPAIFNYSESKNLQCKYDYLIHEMKADKKDLLAFPQYFGYSLESRIRPRHQRLTKLNITLPIQAILRMSDAEFNAKFPSVDGASSMSREVKVGASLDELVDAKLHDSSREASKSTSFDNTETQILVSV